ncbi:short-chain fatty acid transporter [Hornefia butyriciproducens]|uniref:Short-chain fatty acid transporter n=1 Tax=Hornefia butyriciproducens TaxID=2652293 RepID=A0A6L5Y7Z0_9FIRM|nr:short-chain fatty acid transporter [Hornefia butyriciproducens]MCI7414013.1 short-chain fatty acid transporter [Clostridiales bacterium]MCI7678987.1 short-chain fatty acid transporter [Clostridiales bacterium]MDD7020596.1 short-chain fatty acid transporter [Hornefia butyriciproducens]MDY2990420.1 short-chain fatty acid transporter [Hornefia butyriciproducens]MDY5423539.1 short-chain fatty acid transporter [Hornefia butyriciproducens]
MFKKLTDGCVHLVNRYLPDPFIFCIILTIVVFIGALPATHAGVIAVINAWGVGVWNLLAFSMQMVLVLVLGSAFANAPAIKKLIARIASIAKTPIQAIIVVTFFSLLACWLNWGFGLVVGAILAKELARQVKGVDYRLLIASAYSGFVVWHAGISGSIPLALATPDAPGAPGALAAATGGAVTHIISTSQTIFAPWNLICCLIILVCLPFINAKMHPAPGEAITVDPKLLAEAQIEYAAPVTPAEKMENSVICSAIIAIAGLVYLVYYFATSGFNLSLNIVNFIFLILGIIFHKTPIGYVRAIADSAKGAAGIILQFPFYAGIMGMMTFAPEGGTSLAGVISNFFVSISNNVTFPLFTFLSAGIVNFFVPSGGGQWAVQGPIMMPAGLKLGVDPSITGMAIAWGDAWTNMIQPFWALPALGIAGLSARDIMGYCLITLFFVGIVVCGGFVVVGLMA